MTPESFQERLEKIIDRLGMDYIDEGEALHSILELLKDTMPEMKPTRSRFYSSNDAGFNECRTELLRRLGLS